MTELTGAVLWFHILTGAIALLVGVFTLLFTRKGTRFHITTGTLFWYAMIAMASSGVLVAIVRPNAAFVLIGLLSVYLVNTGRNALRRRNGAVDRDTVLWLGVAAGCLVAGIVLGGVALAAGGQLFGSSYALYFGAAFDAAIFVALDWRLKRRGSATGTSRVVDHLWRMIAGLLFAMFALFIANPSVFPDWFGGMGLNFVPPALVFATIVGWVLAVRHGWWKGAKSRSDHEVRAH
jgi:uncharacterized membrane protein